MKNKRTFSWMNPKLEVKDTEKYGKGVFAKKNIKKGEVLAIFGGYIISLEEEKKLPEKFRDGGLQINEKFVISSVDHVEPTDNFNHSCDPNSGFCGQITLFAIRDIKGAEEVTFDYSMCLYSEQKEKQYIFNCNCDSKKCRKKITSNDWSKKNIQKRYKNLFQSFLIDKIKK